jgi:hypothetical protein
MVHIGIIFLLCVLNTPLLLAVVGMESNEVSHDVVADYLTRVNDSNTVPYYYVSNCDKDGSIVGSRVASAVGGIAETRHLEINPNATLAGPSFLEQRANQTMKCVCWLALPPLPLFQLRFLLCSFDLNSAPPILVPKA